MRKEDLIQKAKDMVGDKRHTFESKNDYKDYPCPRCNVMNNYSGGFCWQIKFRELLKDLYEEFAKKHQFDLISFTENQANFKEYDGNGFIKRRYFLKDI